MVEQVGSADGVCRQEGEEVMDKPLWEKKNPRKRSTPLSPQDKAAAKRRAEKAGRPYPNAVDNIAQAQRAKKRS